MQNVVFSPFKPNGSVTAPPSKSDVHRAIICAALSKGKSVISPVALSNDIKATINCVQALGASALIENNVLTIDGTNMLNNKTALLDCSESGSTLRFFIPVAAAGGVNATFTGSGRLPQRPIGIFTEALPKAGVKCKTEGGLPLEISGQLKSGRFEIPGNVSSQFITGLLFALPLLDGDSDIVLTSPIESVGYINMTIYTMSKFGVSIEQTEYGWHIKGNQNYNPTNYTTDGDWSQAAFFMVSGAINGSVTVNGVNRDSAQGDKKISDILKEFGAEVVSTNTSVTVSCKKMHAITIDASQIPDLVPVLAVCAAFAEGTTKIINAERLRIKECDRLTATANLINSLGGNVTELSDGLEIKGIDKLKGGTVDGCNDHRIVMSAGVCASNADSEIESTYALSINKSYPDFYIDYNSIGGKANVLDLR
ncbi:MAG: 3-phosphoshikimate 1-carboxyvinyltransferase [Ruminococcus sp.]|nr:3-phosphoshikimate 1-carboxyvinyltransferase [Ruminococcus sp.]